MLLGEVTAYLESIAPFSLQEDYDNSGILIGEPVKEIKGILCCLDVTEEIIEEAIDSNCNLVIAHHPFIFSGIKQIREVNWVHRVLLKAIKNDIAIMAVHTNLDNVIHGVNGKIGNLLNLGNSQILRRKGNTLLKLSVIVPLTHQEEVKNALFTAGAGSIGNYDECSFSVSGTGSFRPGHLANPFLGEKNKRHLEEEVKIEVVFPVNLESQIIQAMRKSHPYEEIAFDILSLKNSFNEIGAGLVGLLEKEYSEGDFLDFLKEKFNLKVLRHTGLSGKKIQKVAVCGGAGFFLLKDAIKTGADAFITSDLKYHDFFEADGKILLVDVGHFESEQFTIDLLHDQLLQKFPTFAVRKTKIRTNPVNYYF